MTDIVARLRQSYHLDTVQPDHPIRRAADEIERLRAECERLRTALAAGEVRQEPVAGGWMRAIDEALVCSHIGVADPSDDYATAKDKLNRLLCFQQDIGAHFAREELAAPPQPAEPVVTDRMVAAAVDAEDAFYRLPQPDDVNLRYDAMRAALVAAMGVSNG